MALKTNAEKIRQGYINACNAVLGRGGSISSGAPIGDLASAIINIPHDTTLAYHEVNSTAYRTLVPQNAEPYARVNKIGGKSYKTRNLIPFPYNANEPSVHNGITYTIQDNGTVVLNGASTDRSWRILSSELTLTAGKVYTLSGCPSGGSTTGATNPTYAMYISEFKNGAWPREFQDAGNGARFTAQENCVYTVSINVWSAGVTCENLVFKPMLNEGDTALPYEPFFEGIRDTKITALVSEGESSELIDTLAIPEAVQAIDGYGLGVNENYFNYIDFERKVIKGPCRRFVIDSSKGYWVTSQFGNVWLIYVSTLGYGDRIILGIADKYHSLSYNELYAGKEGIYFANASEIYIVDSRFTDAATAKSILSESPVECVCAFDTESETDISEYLTDEVIKVEGGGTITAVNEHEEGVPTSVTYLIETVGG